ncbi:hypothetical protein [Flavobacterium pedocola]
MTFFVTNPRKSFQIEFPLETVQRAVENIPIADDYFKPVSSQPVFNLYTFRGYEIFADINLNAVNDNTTEINIEIRKIIGLFDKSYETISTNSANREINDICTAISNVIGLTDEELVLFTKEKEEKNNKKKRFNRKLYLFVVLPLFLLVILMFAFIISLG